MNQVKNKCYSVITADVIASRGIVSFTHKLTRKLRTLTNLHLRQKLILSPYAVTAGDEFEVVLAKPGFTPREFTRNPSIFMAEAMHSLGPDEQRSN